MQAVEVEGPLFSLLKDYMLGVIFSFICSPLSLLEVGTECIVVLMTINHAV